MSGQGPKPRHNAARPEPVEGPAPTSAADGLSLPLFHRLAGKPVIVVGEGPAAEARRRLVARAGAIAVGEDDGEARLAFVATEAPEALAERLRRRGVLVNVADRPDLCDVTVPALVDRRPLLIAVGTGGASAGLAKWLRLRLEALLPDDLGLLAEALAEAREAIRRRWPDAADRRRALDAALAPGGMLDPLRPGRSGALADWLGGSPDPAQPSCAEITLRSDDPEDLTLREARLLGCADLVLHADGVAPAILDRARADAVRRPLGAAEPGGGLTVVVRPADS